MELISGGIRTRGSLDTLLGMIARPCTEYTPWKNSDGFHDVNTLTLGKGSQQLTHVEN